MAFSMISQMQNSIYEKLGMLILEVGGALVLYIPLVLYEQN